jgi:phage terminase small subunit
MREPEKGFSFYIEWKGGVADMDAKLTAKQRRFCEEYLVDLNATQAAIRAGYSEKTAKVIGCQYLTKPNIKEYIGKRMAEKEDALIAKQDEVLKYLTSVMRGQSKSEIVVVEGTGMGCSAARRMKKKPDEKERLKAAELLGKRYGLYKDTINEVVDMDLNVTVDYGDSNDDED